MHINYLTTHSADNSELMMQVVHSSIMPSHTVSHYSFTYQHSHNTTLS